MSNYNYFLYEVSLLGIDQYIFDSFDKARESGFNHSLVVLPDDNEDKFDVYLTGFKNGDFGEWTCFVEEEFDEDDELLINVIEAVKKVYSHENDQHKRNVLEGLYNLYFTSY